MTKYSPSGTPRVLEVSESNSDVCGVVEYITKIFEFIAKINLLINAQKKVFKQRK